MVNICTKYPDVRIKAIKDEQLTEHYNTGYGSWRYEYSEPALFFNGNGYMTLEELIPCLDRLARCDECEVKDLDLSLDTKAYNEAKRFWEVVVDKQPLTDVERPSDFFTMFKPEYYTEMYGDRDNFAKNQASFSTFAMLLDGEWYEQGKMGWFAMSDTTKESLEKFTDFLDKTLRELKKTHPHATVTLVDCHI